MSTKLNAEELANARQSRSVVAEWTGDMEWAYAAAIREVAQPIADELDRVAERVRALENALHNLIKRCPQALECDDFSHDKSTYHTFEEPCNPHLWYVTALSKAQEILNNPFIHEPQQ
jgi:hypothetical protein